MLLRFVVHISAKVNPAYVCGLEFPVRCVGCSQDGGVVAVSKLWQEHSRGWDVLQLQQGTRPTMCFSVGMDLHSLDPDFYAQVLDALRPSVVQWL